MLRHGWALRGKQAHLELMQRVRASSYYLDEQMKFLEVLLYGSHHPHVDWSVLTKCALCHEMSWRNRFLLSLFLTHPLMMLLLPRSTNIFTLWSSFHSEYTLHFSFHSTRYTFLPTDIYIFIYKKYKIYITPAYGQVMRESLAPSLSLFLPDQTF